MDEQQQLANAYASNKLSHAYLLRVMMHNQCKRSLLILLNSSYVTMMNNVKLK